MFLTKFGAKTTILEVVDTTRASRILQEQVEKNPKMEVRTNTTVWEFKGNGELKVVVVKNLKTDEV